MSHNEQKLDTPQTPEEKLIASVLWAREEFVKRKEAAEKEGDK